MTRKERERLWRKNEMLKAAKQLLKEKGYENTTFKEIAQLSEFSRITLYSYFKDKFDLTANLFFNEIYEFFKLFGEEVENQETYAGMLKLFGMRYYEFFKENPGFHQFVFLLESKRLDDENLSEDTMEIMKKFNFFSRDTLRRIFENGIAAGELYCDLETEIALDTFWKSVYAIIHTYIFHPAVELERLKTELDYLLRAFAK